MYVLKFDAAVEDTRGVVETVDLIDPVDYAHTLKIANIIFVFFYADKI